MIPRLHRRTGRTIIVGMNNLVAKLMCRKRWHFASPVSGRIWLRGEGKT